MTIAAALRAGSIALKAANIPDAPRDARRLMAHALDIAADRLTLMAGDDITTAQKTSFDNYITARSKGQPVSQIIGSRQFFGHGFRLTADVLDPRPETEILVAEALKYSFRRVLDLGTGSGAIILSLLHSRPDATGLGVDLSGAALAVAQENARNLDLAERVDFQQGDWFEGVQGRFDLIVCNPPYITAQEYADLDQGVRNFEPKMALTPGGDGLAPYRVITANLADYLQDNARILMEIGPKQGLAVAEMFKESKLSSVKILRDFDGRDRVVSGHFTAHAQ